MLALFLQVARTRRSRGLTATLRHFGAFGLFALAILDSSPLPTFGGPDILIAILAARHANPWYEYAAVATAGSVIGAYFTYRLARRAGVAYLDGKFGHSKVQKLQDVFHRWGTGALAVSTAVPFPFPTSMFFAAAGASNYGTKKYITVVALCRAARYSLIALLADRYGRQFVRAVRHPDRYWGWLLLFAAVVGCMVALGIFLSRRLELAPGRNRVRTAEE